MTKKPKSLPVRLRLAPSPTGEVHIGTLWLAQFNWLYTKQHHGQFILRIEDTDQKRLVEGSADRIYEALDWLGLQPDEGPREGGDYGPYIQSQRLDRYRQAAERLVDDGHAYHCFCTPERLEQLRAEQTAAKQPPRYDRHCAELSADEILERLNNGESSVIRMKLPDHGSITHSDLIRGDVTFAWDQLDDSVILKSDGFPTYHLAVVVDDHAMEISHVFRAEEWLPSTPKHLFLFQSLGWTPPKFAHFPLILGTDRSKLSKRHGATSALGYRDQGYVPEAVSNFLALMGWHPKGESEILSRADLLEQFSLPEVNSAGAIFDQTKLDWLNGVYIRQLPNEELLKRLKPFWKLSSDVADDQAWQLKAVQLVKDRLKRLDQITELTAWLIPATWNQELHTWSDLRLLIPKQGTAAAAKDALAWLGHEIKQLQDVSQPAVLKSAILEKIVVAGRKNGNVLWPGRVALSLRAASPDIFDIIAALGQSETLRRLKIISQKL